MKSLLTALICLAIVFTPTQRPRAFPVAPFCILLVAVAVAGGVAVYISSCSPSYYCSTSDEAPDPTCRILTPSEKRAGGYKILSGPYKDAKLCDQNCGTNAPTSVTSITITIEKSYDGRSWQVAGTTQGTPHCFEWGETNAALTQCFYRARY